MSSTLMGTPSSVKPKNFAQHDRSENIPDIHPVIDL